MRQWNYLSSTPARYRRRSDIQSIQITERILNSPLNVFFKDIVAIIMPTDGRCQELLGETTPQSATKGNY